MSQSSRLFIAIPISSTLLRQPNGQHSPLSLALHDLSLCGSAFRPTEPSKLHWTLKFLGETPNDRINSIKSRLAEIAAATQPFSLTLQGVGVFPDLKRPTVCWAGPQDSSQIINLAEAVESAIEPLGFPREHRRFQPHLTLGRINSRPAPAFFEWLQRYSTTVFGTDQIQSIVLMKSHWPNGSSYEVLGQWQLR